MKSPGGTHGRRSRFNKLSKPMFGLKQEHLPWHKTLRSCLLDTGFEELPSAQCVLRLKLRPSSYFYILAYVDNLLLLKLTTSERGIVAEQLKKMFEVRVSDNQIR